MLALVRRPFVLGPVFVCLAFASQQSSAGIRAHGRKRSYRGIRPRCATSRRNTSRYGVPVPPTIAGNDSKTKYVEQERLVNSLFRKRLSERDLVQLAASCDALPVHAKERSLFANDLLAFMVRAFVEWGDRDRLITFLSTRCPGHMPWNATVEFHLAFRGRRMRDPILILGEAYSKCTVTEVRHDIAAAVRRAFAGLGIQGKDEADLVANAMKWYARERPRGS
jgi:hypothetical protein